MAASKTGASMPNTVSPRGGSIGAASAGRGAMGAVLDVLASEDRVALTEETGCGSWPPPVGAVLIGVRRGGFWDISGTAEFLATVAGSVAADGTALAVVAAVLGALDAADSVEPTVVVVVAWKVPGGATDGVTEGVCSPG